MKTLIAVLVPIAAVLLTWYLNQREPSLRYQLSSPIETTTGVSVQQIQVANVGKEAAQPVYIRIKKKTATLTVIKDFESDTYKQFEAPRGTVEIVYDQLRPQGRIKVNISGDTLTEQDLEVRDQKAAGTLALSSGERNWLTNIASLATMAIPLAYFVWMFYTMYSDHWERQAKYSPITVFQRARPIFLSDTKWLSYRKAAAEAFGLQTFEIPNTTLSSWPIYRLLDESPPKNISKEHWNEVLPLLTDSLVTLVSHVAKDASVYDRSEKLAKLISSSKPASVLEEKWNGLIRGLGDLYVSVWFGRVVLHSRASSSSLLNALAQSKPANFDADPWQFLREKLVALYESELMRELSAAANPTDFMKQLNVSPISADRVRALTDFAYRLEMSKMPPVTDPGTAEAFLNISKPDFMTAEDYATRSRIASKLVDLSAREARLMDRERQASASAAERHL